MHQGNQWYFGMKAHIGVDVESGLVHAVTTTPATVSDVTETGKLLHRLTGLAKNTAQVVTLFALSNLWMALTLAVGSNHVLAGNADPPFIHGPSFVAQHPDLYWRVQGISDYDKGRYGEAMTDFRRAARFADKPSQAMIAQMLWNGDGVKPDRIMAYVWADLAAERGYPVFIATRERFWRELDADEQRKAVSAGQAIFGEYGDQVAKRREENALRSARLKITGSRTGHVGTLIISQRLPDNRFVSTDGALYYADKYWKPKQYWQWQDSTWEKPIEGKVEVGPIQIPPEH